MPHNKKQIPPVITLDFIGPPNSPPTITLLPVKITKTITLQNTKTIMVKPNFSAGIVYGLSMLKPYCAQITHGSPSPKKILTELEPVTLPTAESAYSEFWAAVTDAKVSGTEVPKATKVIAVIAGGIPRQQPKSSAASPTMAVIPPTIPRAIKNAGQPPPYLTGGINEKKSFHVIKRKCIMASPIVG